MPGPLHLPHLSLRRRGRGARTEDATGGTAGPDGATPDQGAASDVDGSPAADAAGAPNEPGHGPEAAAASHAPVVVATCPSCAVLLDPPPARTRRCPRCRHVIVVRRVDGRTVYLTEAAVEVFEAERRREADLVRWSAERAEWLRLATIAGAPADRIARVAGHHLEAATVDEARALYTGTAERAIKTALKAHDLGSASRTGRELAAALHRAAGSPAPPDPETAAIHAAAMTALLRSIGGSATHAELVGSACCAPCRRDDGRAFKIADELRTPRLPHEGCPRGICACEWWVGVPAPKRARRRPKTPAPG
jgi:hypothetical protein